MLTSEHLIKILTAYYGLDEEISEQDYKYCMYIRKSTDDPERQKSLYQINLENVKN